MKPKASYEDLTAALSYDPETGLFTWLVSPKWNIPKGSIAGGDTDTGYKFIKFRSRPYLSHHLAFFFMTKRWPEKDMDHINGVRDDNRWVNLREAESKDNLLNRKMYNTSTSGCKGVNWHSKLGKWRARIGKHGKRYALGCYDTKEEAYAAYSKAADEMFGEFRRENDGTAI